MVQTGAGGTRWLSLGGRVQIEVRERAAQSVPVYNLDGGRLVISGAQEEQSSCTANSKFYLQTPVRWRV